jgi:iron complex outermembrane receptor protein
MKKSSFVFCMLLSITFATTRAADIPALQETASSGATQESGSLAEIVVTAEKRSENIQNIPISIVAILPSTLTANKIESTQDLQIAVPSLNYGQIGGFAEPFIRGVGSDVLVPDSDPSVATYVDGAFVANNQATIQDLLGVERIEVLEGPQGTLYGRNAVGGAINVITLTPTHQTESDVSLTGGNYARKEASLHVSGGVTDQLAVGVYIGGMERNRFNTTAAEVYTTPLFPNLEHNHESQWGARLKAVYTPTDWLTLTGSVEETQSESFDDGALRELSPNSLGYVLYPDVRPIIQSYVTQRTYPDYVNSRQKNATLREEADIGWANIVGISNYRDATIDDAGDDIPSGTPVYGAFSHIPSDQYSQELQLLSLPTSKVQWIGGLYFFHGAGGFLPTTEASSLFFAPNYAYQNHSNVTTKSYAAFAQTTIPLDMVTDNFRLTLGGRITSDQKYASDYVSYLNAAGASNATIAYPNASHSWERFTPKITIDDRWFDTLFYITYSEGFKSGVYNQSTPNEPPVNPERLNAVEIGAKAQLWDNRINWNTAVYYYVWKDLQVSIVDLGSGVQSLQNAAAAKAHGVDSKLTVAATKDLIFNMALAWESTEYTSFTGYPGVNPVTIAPETINATDNELQRAPKWVTTLGADYHHSVEWGGAIHATLNWYYNGGFYWTPQNVAKQEPYHIVNASLGYMPNESWDVRLWGSNLTNQFHEEILLPVATLGNLATDAPPRMYGVTAEYKFR